MKKKWVVIAVVGIVVYFAWRKFGGTVTSTITNLTK